MDTEEKSQVIKRDLLYLIFGFKLYLIYSFTFPNSNSIIRLVHDVQY